MKNIRLAFHAPGAQNQRPKHKITVRRPIPRRLRKNRWHQRRPTAAGADTTARWKAPLARQTGVVPATWLPQPATSMTATCKLFGLSTGVWYALHHCWGISPMEFYEPEEIKVTRWVTTGCD